MITRATRPLLLLVITLLLVTACRVNPEPVPEQPKVEVATERAVHTYYWPIVGKGWPAILCKGGMGVAGETGPYSATAVSQTGACWYYNWSPYLENWGRMPRFSGSVFVPMIWAGSTHEFHEMEKLCPQYDGVLLVINEGDLSSQAALSPIEAVEVMEQVVSLCPNARLVGPNTSHLDASTRWCDEPVNAVTDWCWTRQFLTLWRQRHGAYPFTLGVHVYNMQNVTEFVEHYLYAASTYGYTGDTAVTEFGYCLHDDDAQNMLTIGDIIQQLELHPRVSLYAPFALRTTPDWSSLACMEMLDRSGRLTNTGVLYANGGRRPSTTAAYP